MWRALALTTTPSSPTTPHVPLLPLQFLDSQQLVAHQGRRVSSTPEGWRLITGRISSTPEVWSGGSAQEGVLGLRLSSWLLDSQSLLAVRSPALPFSLRLPQSSGLRWEHALLS